MRRFAPASAVPPLFLLALAGCASVDDAPSLARRPAEAIDPRVPITDRSAALPADPAIAAALRRTAEPAFEQSRAFDAAIAVAERLAGSAGARGSESWIAAQQALSAAIAAQEPVTRAMGDFDAAVAERVRSGARLVPQDLAAIRSISDDLAALDRRQRAAIAGVQARLSR